MGGRADGLALVLTLGAVVGATVWFGATSPGFLATIEVTIYAAGVLFLLGRPDLLRGRHATALDLPAAALVALPLLQLIRLPAPLHRLLSPGLAGLHDSLAAGSLPLLPLSAYPYATARALCRLSAAVTVFFIISRALTSPGRIRTTLLVLVWLGVAEAAFGLVGYLLDSATTLAGHPQYYPGSVTGTLVCKNHFAGMMEMLIPVSLAYSFAFSPGPHTTSPHEHTARRALALAPALVMALALVFSRSRAGIVCFVFSLAVVLTLAWPRGRRARGRVAVASLGAAFLIYANAIGFDPVIERFQSLSTDYAMTRVEIWRDGLRLALLSPVLGTGAGTWASLFPLVKSTPVQLTFSHAHNDYVQTLAEGGAVGLAVVIWLLAAAYRQARSVLEDRDRDFRQTLLVLLLAAGILAIALHGLVDFNLQIPSNLFLFMALLGLLGAASRPLAFATGSAALSWPAWRRWRGERSARGTGARGQ